MRSLAVAAVCAAAFCATGAVAQTTAQPTQSPNTSPPQQPQTAPENSPTAPTYNWSKFGDVSIAYNFGLATDYAFRGVSQTNENPSVFAGIDATYKAFYGGVWTSNVDFSPFGDGDTNEEIDLYGGWKPTVAGVSLDLGAIYYAYNNQPKGGLSVDYVEVYGKATKAFGPVTVGGSFYYSPDFTGETGDAEYYEANLAYAINKSWSVSGAVGRQEIEKAAAYTTWNAGLTYAYNEHLAFDLRYWDTDEHGFGKPYGDRVIFNIKTMW